MKRLGAFALGALYVIAVAVAYLGISFLAGIIFVWLIVGAFGRAPLEVKHASEIPASADSDPDLEETPRVEKDAGETS